MQPAVDVRKVTLIGLKQKLLDDLDYCENQIAEAKKELAKPKSTYNDSSDSECELALNVASGPSIPCLKYIQTKLQICLKATQELTGLQILQSEVNILVDDPVIVGEPEVTQRGTWKEVTVECRVDLVTFTMSFYVHQPKCNCGQPSYRSLKVAAVKTAQDKELSKSILADVTTPSEAFEVIKSYATAHRSRRTTLASLAEKYGENLFMMPLADGGYQLKCANVMEVSWVLKNNTSPISAFHHQMKFDLEYIDKKYLDIITQANKKLCNPSIDTDERTSLLSTIISSCLEAQAISVQTGSDSESSRAEKRPANTEAEVPAKKRKDAEVMAPPKTLPKKFEAKGKKNKLQNRTNKSAIVEDKEKMPENKRNTDKALGGKNRLSVNVVRLNIKKHVVTQDKETTQAKGKEVISEKKKPKNKVPNQNPISNVASVKNLKKTTQEVNKGKQTSSNSEHIFTPRTKITRFSNSKVNSGNTVKNTTDKTKSGNTKPISIKPKLSNVRGLTNENLKKNNNKGNIKLQSVKNLQANSKKNLLRISPRITASKIPKSLVNNSRLSGTKRPDGGIPRLVKKSAK